MYSRTLLEDLNSGRARVCSSTRIFITPRVPQASLVGFTINQLALPKGAVVIVDRQTADGKHIDPRAPQKLAVNDKLTLRAKPHVLATVASLHHGNVILLKPKESESMRLALADERESLKLAARELYDRLLPVVRRCQGRWAEEERRRRAASRIQAMMRGYLAREQTADDFAHIHRRRFLANLAVRRTVSRLTHQRMARPIIHGALLDQLSRPTSPVLVVAEAEAEDDQIRDGSFMQNGSFKQTGLYAVIGARRCKIARTHELAVNALLTSSAEGAKGAVSNADGARVALPLKLIRLLTSEPLVVTAEITMAEFTLEQLDLPKDIQLLQYRINKNVVSLKKRSKYDPKMKLRKGDDITLCALPHRLALLTEVKSGKLIVAKKHRVAEADALAKGYDMLRGLLGKLAHWLQSAVRIHLAQRDRARRAHAALVVQCFVISNYIRRQDADPQRWRYAMARHAVGNRPEQVVAEVRVEMAQNNWLLVRKQHRAKVMAVGILNSELKRLRQKKKPSALGVKPSGTRHRNKSPSPNAKAPRVANGKTPRTSTRRKSELSSASFRRPSKDSPEVSPSNRPGASFRRPSKDSPETSHRASGRSFNGHQPPGASFRRRSKDAPPEATGSFNGGHRTTFA